MGKSTISMAIFNCYVSSPEGKLNWEAWQINIPRNSPAARGKSYRLKICLLRHPADAPPEKRSHRFGHVWRMYIYLKKGNTGILIGKSLAFCITNSSDFWVWKWWEKMKTAFHPLFFCFSKIMFPIDMFFSFWGGRDEVVRKFWVTGL